jgi:predicted nucleic acid-binding protein
MLARRFVNTSPLVFLVRENLLAVLRVGVDDVAVPEPVIEEIHGHGMDDPTVQAIDQASWLTIVPGPVIPRAIADWRLGPGESAVLALAHGDPECQVVLDDLSARRCAVRLGITCLGTLGIVPAAKRLGNIPTARPLIERLRLCGLYLDDELVHEVLKRVGE